MTTDKTARSKRAVPIRLAWNDRPRGLAVAKMMLVIPMSFDGRNGPD